MYHKLFNFSIRPNHTRKIHLKNSDTDDNCLHKRQRRQQNEDEIHKPATLKNKWAHFFILITSIILHYHDDLLTSTSGESQNNDETYMYRRNKSSISPKSLLASFIKEGIYIRLYSGNCIHVHITSHFGNGKECIVFLA
ncbi:unnamed protein product [Rhizophagus irregularis]|uniref:Uncharacterized protein n=1 Tax=Rhizophagus irregularis TaxID=588596 RepID=A0A916EBT9_9GLOM|nr:unnamed protein product [Rhizophagus irregularis]CAB5375728.1 unnamed protein product [Rhizophagus irregularis]